MKRLIVALALLLFPMPHAEACVGKTLTIGVTDSSQGKLIAELLSAVIQERTGTTVKIRFFASSEEVAEAAKVKQVDILIGNTARALQTLNRPKESDPAKAYDIVKAAYEKDQGLIWLKPFKFLNGAGGGGPSYTATVLRIDIVNNFPALPRVIGKLGPVLDDAAYSRLLKAVEAGGAPKAAARDFLKSKKII